MFFASQAFVTALLVTLLVAGVNLLRTRFLAQGPLEQGEHLFGHAAVVARSLRL